MVNKGELYTAPSSRVAVMVQNISNKLWNLECTSIAPSIVALKRPRSLSKVLWTLATSSLLVYLISRQGDHAWHERTVHLNNNNFDWNIDWSCSGRLSQLHTLSTRVESGQRRWTISMSVYVCESTYLCLISGNIIQLCYHIWKLKKSTWVFEN